jgi:hypothetical protein
LKIINLNGNEEQGYRVIGFMIERGPLKGGVVMGFS